MTWEEEWAAMSPEDQAAYSAAMGGAAPAATNAAMATNIARWNAAPTTQADILRMSESGGGVPSSLGVLGPDGKYYTDAGVAASFTYPGSMQQAQDFLKAGKTSDALAIIQQKDPNMYAILTNKESSPYDQDFQGQSFRTPTTSWDELIAGRYANYSAVQALKSIDPAKVNDVLLKIRESDPQLYASLTNKETSPFDFDANGKNFRGETTTYEQMILGRLNNYTSGGGNQREGGLSAGDVLSLMTGIPNAQAIGNVLTGKANTGDWMGAVSGVPGLGEGQRVLSGQADLRDVLGVAAPGTQTEAAPGLFESGQAAVDSISDEQLPQGPTVPTGADESGGPETRTGGIVATAPSAINRADFDVARIQQPWVSPELQQLLGSATERAVNYQGDTAPVISEGTPEQIARYNASIQDQQRMVNDLGSTAGNQRALANEMTGLRNMYVDAAQGNVPSVAELQAKQQLALAQRQALSMARTARDPGAMYRAQRVQGNLANQAVAQGQIARAGEMATARGLLSSQLGVESWARSAATQGAGTVAGAQQQITADQIQRLAQQQGISTAEAQALLQNQQQNNAMEINLGNLATTAANTELQSKAGAASENRAIGEAGAQYAQTKATSETARSGTDVDAQLQRDLEAERTRRAETVAKIGGGAALLGGLVS